MSGLCGAWALEDAPIRKLLQDADRRAALEQLSVAPASLAEFTRGRLWVAGRSDLIASAGERCAAADGLLLFDASGPRRLNELLAPEAWPDSRPWAPPAGHYVLACADLAEPLLLLCGDPTGGERLYYTRASGMLLFASSMRSLLAHSRVSRRLDRGTAAEFLLNGLVLFGNRTLLEGIEEVPTGQVLRVERGGASLRELRPVPERPPPRELSSLAGTLRESLSAAVRAAVGADGRASVSLSGGLDSSAVASAAVEALGASNVRAFTMERVDPGIPSEAGRAGRFCRHLGIEHRVVPLTLRQHLDAIPEMVWRMEDPAMPLMSRWLTLARAARSAGCGKLLTGHELLSLSGYGNTLLGRLARSALRPPWLGRFPGYWRARRFPEGRWEKTFNGLLKLAPLPDGLDDNYFLVVCGLRHAGLLADASAAYPRPLRSIARAATESPRVQQALDRLRDLPLETRWNHVLCVGGRPTYTTIRASQKPFRELGVALAAPLLSPRLWPLVEYFYWHAPPEPAPGNFLLLEAMREGLPAEFLAHKRGSIHTARYQAWRDVPWRAIETAVEPFLEPVGGILGLAPKSLAHPFFRRNLAKLALFQRVFIEAAPRAEPPSWEGVGPA
ncbi:MAG: hypothetical protein HY554_13280 [Elusimicrobia bacterium]|nr:hypothetical protein [Elusimicrobiota bacterium]